MTTSSVLSRRRLRGRRDSKISDISDRLAEDARIFLLIVERQQTSYDVALDGLVRDAFGSADRLRVAAAAAQAGGWPTAVVEMLERGADRAEHAPPPRPHRVGSAPEPSGGPGRAPPPLLPSNQRGRGAGHGTSQGRPGSLEQSEPGSKQPEHA